MQTNTRVAVLICLGVTIGAAAWAQSAPPTKPSPAASYAPRTTTDVPEDVGVAPALARDIETTHLTARDLRDKPVFDMQNQQIATVSDVTGNTGATEQAILETGGVLGIGSREVALPINKLSVAPDGRLVLHMTADELKLLPKYR